jgi:NAD(P)-dependent dehydrogenase (short-subunit alcohol dehydrogenase family)
VALVTGASRGIGKAIAIRLAAEGASVAVVARTPAPTADSVGSLAQTIEEVERVGSRGMQIARDLGDPSLDRGMLVDQVEAALGPVDILVNNAAAGGYQLMGEWTDAQIRHVLELNFWAPWQLTRRVLPGMVERGRGSILNISSASALRPDGPPFPQTITSTRGTIYGGTKAMMDRWTVSVAAEVQGTGVVVNTLAPQAAALTETLLTRRAGIPPALIEPLETMAEAAVALCTGDPESLTGQVTYSLALLAALGRPVHDLSGDKVLEEWGPGRIPAVLEAQAESRRRDRGLPSQSDRLDR